MNDIENILRKYEIKCEREDLYNAVVQRLSKV